MMRRAPLVLVGLLAATCGGNGGPGPSPIAGAPQITCPADVTMRGVLGPAQPVTFTAPVVTGGELPNTVTCSRTSGTAFPLGTTAVSCSVSDARGRQASCAFNVTLTALSLAVTKYLAVGDSFTEGQNGLPGIWTFVDPPNSYPTKLQGLFEATFPGQGITVVNRGFGGYTVERTVEELRDDLRRHNPGAVLVLSGYNNLLSGGCRVADGPSHPLCPSSMAAVLLGVRDCIRKSKEAPFNIPYVFVSTLTPSGPGPIPPGINDRRLRADVIVQVNAGIRQLVAAEGAILADTYPRFVGNERDYVSIDGLHLLPPGNQAIADSFFAAIRAAIPQTPLFSAR